MPSNKLGTIWSANKHTLAKIEILRGYLNAFFPILGSARRNQNILFVDGFAGPGEYTNSPEGSPIAAMRAANDAVNNLGDRWIAGELRCAFIEPDRDRCDNLRRRVGEVPLHSKVKPQVLEKTFVEGIADIKKQFPGAFGSGEPLFVFIDPFGATGVPFHTVSSILSSPTSEVLINLDSDGIGRNVCVEPSTARDDLLTSIFGDESWRVALSSPDVKKLYQQILELYKTKLRAIPRVEYVFSFEMRGINDLLNYHLVFASQNPRGLEKMKGAMRSIDKSGSFCFSDGAIGAAHLFNFDDPKDFASKLYDHFVGQTMDYGQIMKFALNETPFTNPISMLKVLDQHGQIETTRHDPESKAFSKDKVKSIQFLAIARRTVKIDPVQPKRDLFDGH